MNLAHKDEEHEEAAKEIETVDHPEEHLQVGGVVTQPALNFCVCSIVKPARETRGPKGPAR